MEKAAFPAHTSNSAIDNLTSVFWRHSINLRTENENDSRSSRSGTDKTLLFWECLTTLVKNKYILKKLVKLSLSEYGSY